MLKCEQCHVDFQCQEDWELHLKSAGHHSADDQVLISSLLALAGDVGPSNSRYKDFIILANDTLEIDPKKLTHGKLTPE